MNTSQKFPWVWLSFAIIFVMLLFVTGCESSNIIRATLTPTLTPSPFPRSTCVPEPNGFYMGDESALGEKQTTKEISNRIYADFLYARQIGISPASIKAKALDILAYETWRWSHIAYIKIDANNSLRLLMTFVSPELVRAAVLNHAIYSMYPEPIGNLDELTNKVLTKLDKKNELLFMIVVQPKTTDQSSIPIEILPENIILRNTSGLDVHRVKSEDLTPNGFTFSSSLHTGFLTFPIGRLGDRTQCVPLVHPQRDISLTLDINGIKIGDMPSKDVSWEIPFAGAIGVLRAKPTPNSSFTFDDSVYSPLDDISGLNIPDENQALKKHSELYQFWLVYARFIWSRLTLDNVGQ